MGLDQYLYARINAPQGSALAEVVDKHLTDEQRKQLVDEDWGNAAYVSGWNFPDSREPEALYLALVEATGVTPHGSSPHFYIEPDEDGYLVKPALFYWRKENAIHRWFVERVQNGVDNCEEFEVHPEMLMELIEKCDEVTADHSKAQELLPTQGGFFFGGTDFDDWYFDGLKDTAEGLRAQIAKTPTGTTFTYHSSW